MMVLSIPLAVACACVSMVTVEGFPSQKYYPFATNDQPAFNSNPNNEKVIQTYQDEFDDSDKVMQIQEKNDYHFRPSKSSFQEKSGVSGVAYMSSYYNKAPTYEPVKPTSLPYTAIVYLVNNAGDRCTGTFILPQVILTAAHCLYEIIDSKGVELHVQTILRQKGCDGDAGAISFTGLYVYVPNEYKKTEDRNYDYALIYTKEESDEFLNVETVNVKNLALVKIEEAGYPGDSNPKRCLMKSAGLIQHADPSYSGRFYHNCDTAPGMSGGAVRNEKNNIIGVDSKGFLPDVDPSVRFNKAVAMSKSVVEDLQDVISNHFP